MPISEHGCKLALGTLQVGRLSGSPKTDQEAADIVKVFVMSFGDWSDAQLNAAVLAYLNSADPGARFWPTPGALRAALPVERAEALITGEAIWPVVWSLISTCGGGVEHSYSGPNGEWAERHRVGYWKNHMIQRYGLAVMRCALSALGGVEGYDLLAKSDPEDGVAHRARFCKAWDAAGKQQEEQVLLKRLEAMVEKPLQIGANGRPKLEAIQGGADQRPRRQDEGWDAKPERFGRGGA